MNPQTLLAGSLKARIVTLTFGTESVSSLEGKAVTVNGKTVIIGNGNVLGTAPVFLAVVPVLVIAGAGRGFGLTERTVEFLVGSAIFGVFSILIHSEADVTDGMAGRKLLGVPGVPWIKGNYGVALVHIPDKIVNGYHVISLIGNESAFRNRKDLICFGKDTLCDGGIGDIGRRSQFPDGQTGDAVHKHMVFVAPVKLEVLLVMLVGSGMDA